MNKILHGVLRFSTLYAKMEIVGGLILVMVILLYALFPNYSQKTMPSVEVLTPTTQE